MTNESSNTAEIQDVPRNQLRMMVYASLLAALIAVGAFISIPIGPVPIVLQNFFVLLAGLLLGPKWGTASVALYLLAGCLGLPVFAGGTGGIGHIAGPTGGYLLSYLPAVFLVGWIARKNRHGFWGTLTALLLGSLVVYACGVPWLKIVTGMPWGKAVAVGMAPFLLGDAVKVLAAVPVSKTLRPLLPKQ